MNYAITELEALAILFSLDKLRPHVYGWLITEVVYHCALCQLKKGSKLNSILTRWSLSLQEYNLYIIYRSVDVDCLSRAIIESNKSEELGFKAFAIIPIDNWSNEYSDKGSKSILTSITIGDRRFTLVNGLIYQEDKLYTPSSKRATILEDKHSNDVAGHSDVAHTADKIEQFYYWPLMDRDIKKFGVL